MPIRVKFWFRDELRPLQKDERRIFLRILISGMAMALLEMLALTTLVPVVGMLLAPDSTSKYLEEHLPQWIQHLIFALSPDDPERVWMTLALFFFLVRTVILVWLGYLQSHWLGKLIRSFLLRFFEHFFALRPLQIITRTRGEWMRLLVEYPRSYVVQVLVFTTYLFAELWVLLVLYSTLIWWKWTLAIPAGMFLVGLGFLIRKGLITWLQNIQHSFQKDINRFFSLTEQAVDLPIDLRILRAREFFMKQLDEISSQMQRAYASYVFLQPLPFRLLETGGVLTFLILVLLIAPRNLSGESAITFSTFLLFTARMLPSVARILSYSNHLRVLQFIPRELSRFFQMEESEEPSGEKTRFADPVQDPSQNVTFFPAKLSPLHFHTLTFRYPGKSTEILREVSGLVCSGTILCVQGPSGTGKTTLLLLLAKVLEPINGEIYAGQTPLHRIPRNVWWSHLGWMGASLWLVEGTLWQNVALSSSFFRIDVERLREVLEVACVTDFLPGENALHTWISPASPQFSMGERQRIVLARALYHARAFLLLDEPTAHLDPRTEEKLMQNLRRWTRKHSIACVLVSHREIPARYSDQILQLN